MKFRIVLTLFICVITTFGVNAQFPAEFAGTSMPAPPNGPATATAPARLLQNTAGTTFNTPNTSVTVTASTSNQQYTGTSTGAGSPVLFFGSTIQSSSVSPLPQPIFNAMSTVGSAVDTNFSNTVSGSSTGINVAANYAFNVFTSVNHWNGSASPSTNNVRIRMADLTLTFSSPVTNPHIHLVGVGGATGGLGFSTEFDLLSTQSATGPISASLVKLQGNSALAVTATQVNSGVSTRGAACSTNTAGCGTVRLVGSNITSVTFRVYVRGDGNNSTWGTAGNHGGDQFLIGVSIPSTVSLAGTVFNDLNGLTDATVNGTGTNNPSGTQLYANLVDPSDNTVIGSVAVAAGGSYSFNGLPADTTARVEISTAQGLALSPAPAIALPAGWVNVGESPGDASPNGALTVPVAAANVTSRNFGINQRPTANDNTASVQVNPGGTFTLVFPAGTFGASDPAGGTVSSIRITAFPSSISSVTINGINYTSATFPAGGVIVPANAAGNPTQPILVDPFDGPRTVNILYVAIDNAGVESGAAATASLPVSAGTTAGKAFVSGRVLNDRGRGAPRSIVYLVDQYGAVRTAVTNPFGHFHFAEVEVNEIYIIFVSHKRHIYQFRTVDLMDDMTNVDFEPEP